MQIDWAATGNWMQAWAGFAQAGAIVFVAYKGSDAFNIWRKQAIAGRRLDTAEHILDVVYRVRRSLKHVREGYMGNAELIRAETHLKLEQSDWFDELNGQARQRAISGQVALNRLADDQREWDELWAVMPKARSFFGSSLEVQLQNLWRQRGTVAAAAQVRAAYSILEEDVAAKLGRALWTGYGTAGGAKNEVDEDTAEACHEIERVLRPLLFDGNSIS
ncbi:hypothetical protein [Sphingomonas sp. PP-CC-3A-396]|uniref:hypothetical protein n=1 Tax=Sphingomonas sp. PP-CC-3A-396 TaxID=2135655 RepID=UPI00104EF792|nr:hypothetical protein [Sphingomonas sp. PP-CC-3A-396]TCQ04494.1 hypothetical protein C8J40_108141 [Sphingomonas sp. PP-CC-3A-396]